MEANPDVQVNILAVLVATAAYQVIGALWYSPLLFAKSWIGLVQLKDEAIKKVKTRAYLGCLAASFVCAYVLAHFIHYTGAGTVSAGAQCGFWLWLGFAAATSASNYLFENRPLKLYLINNGFHLVSLIAMGVILALWQ